MAPVGRSPPRGSHRQARIRSRSRRISSEYLAAHPDELAIRNAAMTSISSVELPQILAAYDFSQFKCIADLGGGHGALLYGILSKNPQVRGILADLPHVVAGRDTLALQANGGALRDNRY